MTRLDLARNIALEMNLPLPEAKHVVEFLFGKVAKAIRSGDRVILQGFGSFEAKTTKPRQGRNPKTGKPIAVPAKTRCRFRPAAALMAAA